MSVNLITISIFYSYVGVYVLKSNVEKVPDTKIRGA